MIPQKYGMMEAAVIMIFPWRFEYMPRAKKDAKILNVKLATPVYDRLEEFCDESGMSKNVAAEKIFTQFFNEYFERPESERTIFQHSVKE